MPNPVVHFEVVGKDGKKLQDFYSRAFDWKIDANNPMDYGMVEAQGGGIGGGISATEPGGQPRVTVYIEVDSPSAFLKKVEGLGGRTIMPETEIPGAVTMALFTDPEGNIVGLVKSGPPPS